MQDADVRHLLDSLNLCNILWNSSLLQRTTGSLFVASCVDCIEVNSCVMRLYIIAGRINIVVPDLTLVDGYRPSVGGYRPSTIDFEPAIWFKVMLLDAVTIDCDERRLSWVPLCDSSVSNFAALDSGIALCGSYRLSSSSAGDDHQHHLIDFSDDTLCSQLTEAFDIVPDLLARYESNQIMREDFNEQLMHLLHVHVLPSIRLTAQDTDYIVECIRSLGVIIDQLDVDILEIAEKIRLAEQSLTSLRKKMVCQLLFSDGKAHSDSMFSHDFIDLLLSKKGIEKDIEIAWADVERAQSTVEKLKENSEADSAALRSQRAERDRVTTEYEKLLAAREKLKEMRHSRRGIVKRVRDAFATASEDPQHKIYVGIISKSTEFEKLNQLITHKKLLVTSVKEAARLALNDIQSGSDSFGMEVDCVRAAHSTDVLGGNITASWQSVAEQIASILGNNSHQIAKLHRDFCHHVADVCSATGMEKQLYDESLQALQHPHHSSTISNTKPHNSMTHSNSSGSISEFHLDLSNAAFYPSDCVSLPEEQNCRLSKSVELSLAGHSRQESLVKSLPLLSQSVDGGSSSVQNLRSVSVHSQQKVDQKPELFRMNSSSHRKGKHPSLTASFRSYVPHGLISIYPQDSGRDSPVIIVDTDRDCVRKALESLRKKILDHFDRISMQLQQELSASSGKSQYRQVWLDYESHFYQEMMTPLSELYQLQYSGIIDAFCSSLLELTPSDLSLDDAVLVHLLQDRQEESVCVFESCTPPVFDSKDSLGAGNTVTRCTDLRGSRVSCGVAKDGQVDVSADTDDLSRLLRSHSEESRGPRLRTVRISMPVIVMPHSPTSVLVYERTLAPLPSESFQSNTRLTLSATTMILKPYYQEQFSSALRHIELAIEARTPSCKLRHLNDCLRETTKQLAAFYAELYGDSSSQSSCDELLDAVVILLCNIDGRQMAMLYCQLKLLAELMAPWLEHGPYSFTLVQFTCACQFIQERLMLKRNRYISKQA